MQVNPGGRKGEGLLYSRDLSSAGTSTNVSLGNLKKLCNERRLKEALHILDQGTVQTDSTTYVCLLQACIKLKALAEGKQVHAHINCTEFRPSIFLFNTLINMYAKCGSILDARRVFEEMPKRNKFTWNMVMAGYAKHGHAEETLKLYDQMQQEGVTPDAVTYSTILNACTSLGALEKGKWVHADSLKVSSDIILENSLVHMYAKCGSMKDARTVFDKMVKRDVVSWSVMIAGYAQQAHGEEALELYGKMQREGLTPDRVAFICVLNACAGLRALEKGKQVHADMLKVCLVPDIIVENTLVDMYAKCRSIRDARQVFTRMAKRDVVSWNAIIAGYVQCGQSEEALKIYVEMQREGIVPNSITYICVLNACAGLGALEKGKRIHAELIKAGIVPCIILGTSLVDMYAKCGSVKDARLVFDKMIKRNLIAWSAMIAGYAQHGCGREALQLFEQMQQEGLKPNSITFSSVLSACSHLGLVNQGCHHFDSMSRDYRLRPTMEHFGCVVDLLGRAGRLDEAEDFIAKMPMKPNASVLRTLLGACRLHGNVQIAERAVKSFLRWEPHDPAEYALLSTIYAAAVRWDEKAKVRKMMEDRGVRKEPVHSCMEVNDQGG